MTTNIKIAWGIIVLVLAGGVAYAYLYPQNTAPQSGADLSETQKLDILEGLAGDNKAMTEKQKIKLLESLK